MKAVWISMLSICLGGAIFGYLPNVDLIASGVLIAIAATIAWFKLPQFRSFTPTAAALMFLALMLAAQSEWGVGSLANTLLFVGFGVMFIAAIFCAGLGKLSQPRNGNVA
jgi:hypothetical protein